MTSKTFSPGTVIDSDWLNAVNTAVYTTLPAVAASTSNKASLGLGNVDNTSDANKPVSTAQQTALNAKQDVSAKDATGGYTGLTGYNINFKNVAGTFTASLTNANTTNRTYTFPDKNITVAGTAGETFTKPIIKGYVEQFQALNPGATVTANPDNGTIIELTLGQNTTVTLPAASAGVCYTIIVSYAGAFTPTFSGGTLKWAGGAAPTPTSITGKLDKYVFTCGASYTLGQDGGRNF